MINNNDNYIVNQNKVDKYYKILKALNIDNVIEGVYGDIYSTFLNSMKNSNKCLIIIESMCIGLVLTDYIAFKFGYIRSLMEYDKCEKYKNYNIKIFRINTNWDTRKWSYLKICKFHMHLDYYEQLNCEQIKDVLANNRWKKQNIDFEFLQSLCWDPPKLEESDINIDLSGNVVNENTVDLSGNAINENPIAWYESSYFQMG